MLRLQDNPTSSYFLVLNLRDYEGKTVLDELHQEDAFDFGLKGFLFLDQSFNFSSYDLERRIFMKFNDVI